MSMAKAYFIPKRTNNHFEARMCGRNLTILYSFIVILNPISIERNNLNHNKHCLYLFTITVCADKRGADVKVSLGDLTQPQVSISMFIFELADASEERVLFCSFNIVI